MRSDPRLGAVVRQLRSTHGLTLAAIARRAGCAESTLSLVENGQRTLQPWLAAALDDIFHTGGTITALTGPTYPEGAGNQAWPNDIDVILVRIPQRGITVPVSRRELLAALGIGAVGGTLLPSLQHAVAPIRPSHELLAEAETTLTGLQMAGRTMPPGRLIAPLTAQVGLLETVRRRARPALQASFATLQARFAESLSWMAEESGDLAGSLYWTDRTGQWAAAAGWNAMTAYVPVRRSMLTLSYAGDGLAAVEHAGHALRMPAVPPRIRGLAAKQAAFGYALAGRHDACKRALEDVA